MAGPGRRRLAIVTVALLILCQSFQVLVTGAVALFLPRIRGDLEMSFTEAGTLSAVSTLVYALGQLPAGYLADRFGSKWIFFIGALGTSAFGFTFGLIHSYGLAVANQAVAGLFRSLLFAPGLTLIASWFPPNRRATAMGLYIAGGFSSNIVLNLVGPPLAEEFGWRVPFLAFSAAGVLAAAAYARCAQEGPDLLRGQTDVREALRLFRYPVMWVVGGIQYVRLAAVLGTAFWLPSFFVDERGLSLTAAGLLIALGGLLMAPSNFLGGYLADRLQNPYLVIGVSLAMIAITTSLLVAVDNRAVMVASVLVNAVFVQFYFGPLFSVPIELLGSRRAGISSGFSNTFANLGGLTFGYTIGALRDATGSFEVGFYVLSGTCVVGLILTLVLAAMRRRLVPPAGGPGLLPAG